MQLETGHSRLTNRIGALVLLALAIAYGIGGAGIEYSFSSDPLGPKVFPLGLAAILGVLSIAYFLKPGSSESWPAGRTLIGALGLPALVAVCALMLEPFGFPAAIFVLTLGTAIIFGAALRWALPAAVAHGIGWYFLFAYLLDVQLPLGTLFGH